VAIKVIKSPGRDEAIERKLRRETLVWYSATHLNIYPFYGCATDKMFGTFGALISPWCHHGDASQFLGEHGGNMAIAERLKLWSGVIDGVSYLHGLKPPVVHGDLKPGNILIDNDLTPKICDFGLARILSDEGDTGMTTTSEHTGTVRYLSPELVSSGTSVPPTLASDVYALGSLGLEFVYLQKPYSHHKHNLQGQIFRDLRKGVPPATSIPEGYQSSSQHTWRIIRKCWISSPSSRPTAPALGRML
ncbi:hypothetical protein M408DRAFT_52112, partial [Serendipita vermifera MAFF 305830]